MNTKTCIFTCCYRHSWKFCFWCSVREIKFHLTLKKIKYPLFIYYLVENVFWNWQFISKFLAILSTELLCYFSPLLFNHFNTLSTFCCRRHVLLVTPFYQPFEYVVNVKKIYQLLYSICGRHIFTKITHHCNLKLIQYQCLEWGVFSEMPFLLGMLILISLM